MYQYIIETETPFTELKTLLNCKEAGAFRRAIIFQQILKLFTHNGGNGGAVVTHSPPTSEVGSSNPKPYVGKMVVSD